VSANAPGSCLWHASHIAISRIFNACGPATRLTGICKCDRCVLSDAYQFIWVKERMLEEVATRGAVAWYSKSEFFISCFTCVAKQSSFICEALNLSYQYLIL